ncbi:hypothetical protein GCM10009716_40170 [Streptomyces sodiiphilus]|uniref:Tail assembly chaperone n=1 Tax=Streptomyces sodiiphilus TaxID=226217 RepID=A0ABP5B2F4_9ACTN
MTGMEDARFRTRVRGEAVEVPATITGIRATLRDEEIEHFNEEIERTPAAELPRVLAYWALLHTGAHEEDEEIVERLRRGDFSGCVPAEEAPRGASEPGAA